MIAFTRFPWVKSAFYGRSAAISHHINGVFPTDIMACGKFRPRCAADLLKSHGNCVVCPIFSLK
jgi:hypothetical protein